MPGGVLGSARVPLGACSAYQTYLRLQICRLLAPDQPSASLKRQSSGLPGPEASKRPLAGPPGCVSGREGSRGIEQPDRCAAAAAAAAAASLPVPRACRCCGMCWSSAARSVAVCPPSHACMCVSPDHQAAARGLQDMPCSAHACRIHAASAALQLCPCPPCAGPTPMPPSRHPHAMPSSRMQP